MLSLHSLSPPLMAVVDPSGDGEMQSSLSVDGHGVTSSYQEDFDSTCSTPYVSAPSSPGRDPGFNGYFFSAPASPMHFVLSSAASESVFLTKTASCESSTCDFEFSSRFASSGVVATGAMSSADELFLNGQIRPMKLSSHLQRPQILAPLRDPRAESQENDDLEIVISGEEVRRGRDLKLRSRSQHRNARSLSPLRNAEIQWLEVEEEEDGDETENGKTEKHIIELQDFERKQSETTSTETTPSCSASSSRSSSTGRNSMKWIFLKDLLYRSKSEGRGIGTENSRSFIPFSPSKEKPLASPFEPNKPKQKLKKKQPKPASATKKPTGKPTNGVAKRRTPPSPHELHYTANRAQAEEMKKRTFLPYRQGLLGCLGFKSKGYGTISGLTRALNRPVSST